MGLRIDGSYRAALGVDQLTPRQVADVLVDLKRRIHVGFFVSEQEEVKIVLGNRICPFAEKVIGRPALCMMTSNVFGHIAAENLGYARVELEQTIAEGDPGCRVVIHLHPPQEDEPVGGREYYQG